MSENEVMQEGGAIAVQQQATPMRLIEMAVSQNADVDKLEKLFQLQLAWEKNEANKAFVTALNAFKADPPKITKNKEVDFSSAKGRTHYKHATLDQVSGVIGEALAKVGISHRWETEQMEGGLIKVTCILTHALGHSERVWLQASRDETGNKNNIQAVGSTVTYLQRYTLLAATGMAVQDQDDDGNQGAVGMPEAQKADWLAAIDAVTDLQDATDLWKRIAEACTVAGDVPAFADLKAVMAKKQKSFSTDKGQK